MENLKVYYEQVESKNGNQYYRIYVIVKGVKLYLQFTDFTSKRIFEEAIKEMEE